MHTYIYQCILFVFILNTYKLCYILSCKVGSKDTEVTGYVYAYVWVGLGAWGRVHLHEFDTFLM